MYVYVCKKIGILQLLIVSLLLFNTKVYLPVFIHILKYTRPGVQNNQKNIRYKLVDELFIFGNVCSNDCSKDNLKKYTTRTTSYTSGAFQFPFFLYKLN